jgi:hypothetical protein
MPNSEGPRILTTKSTKSTKITKDFAKVLILCVSLASVGKLVKIKILRYAAASSVNLLAAMIVKPVSLPSLS